MSPTVETRPADTRPLARIVRTHWGSAAAIVALVVAGLVVSLLRVPAAHQDFVWAEDGSIFLDELLKSGPFATLFHGYAGYQHLVPRLGAMLITGILPIGQYAIGVFVLCSVLTGLTAAAVFWLSRDLVPWFWARVALGMIAIVLPLSSAEVLGNLADIHSYCMWLAPWLLLYRPRTWATSALWAVVMLLCSMTEVQTILFLPLIAFRFRRQDRMALPIVGAYLVGVAAQVITTLVAPRPSTAHWLGIPSIVEGWLVNTVLPLVYTNPDTQRQFLMSSGMLVPTLIVIPFAIAAIVALVLGSWRQRLLVITLLLASAAIYAAGATADGSYPFRYEFYRPDSWLTGYLNVRYGVSSGMMLASVVPVAAAVLWARPWRHAAIRIVLRVIAAASLVGLVGGMAYACTNTVSVRDPKNYETWSSSVSTALQRCPDKTPDTLVPLPIAPDRVLRLSCETIEQHSR